MECRDCKLTCAAHAEPQNVAMQKACTALVKRCRKYGRQPENPMSWLRGYAEEYKDSCRKE